MLWINTVTPLAFIYSMYHYNNYVKVRRFAHLEVQGPPSSQSLGFEVHVLESSHGCLAAPMVSYCPSRTSELQPTVITKHSDWLDGGRCRRMEHEPSSSVRVTRGHRKSFGMLQWTAGFAVYYVMAATTTNEIESCPSLSLSLWQQQPRTAFVMEAWKKVHWGDFDSHSPGNWLHRSIEGFEPVNYVHYHPEIQILL